MKGKAQPKIVAAVSWTIARSWALHAQPYKWLVKALVRDPLSVTSDSLFASSTQPTFVGGKKLCTRRA